MDALEELLKHPNAGNTYDKSLRYLKECEGGYAAGGPLVGKVVVYMRCSWHFGLLPMGCIWSCHASSFAWATKHRFDTHGNVA